MGKDYAVFCKSGEYEWEQLTHWIYLSKAQELLLDKTYFGEADKRIFKRVSEQSINKE